MNKSLIILKLGGSIITYKDHPSGKLRTKRLKEIALEIKRALQEKKVDLILINGAGSYGHPIAKKYGIANGIKNKAQACGFCEIKQTVQLLTTRLNKIFLGAGLNTFLCQTSSLVVQNQGAINSFNLRPIKRWLHLGFIPFLSGDVAADIAWGGSICSGDALAPYLAKKLRAERMLYASDVEGIFDRNPQIYQNAKFIPKITKKISHKSLN